MENEKPRYVMHAGKSENAHVHSINIVWFLVLQSQKKEELCIVFSGKQHHAFTNPNFGERQRQRMYFYEYIVAKLVLRGFSVAVFLSSLFL